MAAEATIGGWSETALAKYVRELVSVLTPDHIPGLTVDDLIIEGSFKSFGTVTFNRKLVTVATSGAPTFEHSWVAATGFAPPAYWKGETGIVYLEGTASGGTVGSSAWTLPPGFRPDKKRVFSVHSNSTLGLVQIDVTGIVTPLAVGTASNASYSFDGISFRTTKT